MPATSNTSPLIALTKTGRLRLLKELYGTVIVPPFVKGECVDKGKVIGAADAYEIEKGVQEGWIKVVALGKKSRTRARTLTERARIGQGEAEAIVLAKERRLLVILDDAEARAVARGLGVQHMGTVMVPYVAFVRRLISRQELVAMLADLSRVLWISPTVIAEVLRMAQEGRK